MADGELNMHISDWRGYSAYEIAVQNGYSGTQQEWLASLAQSTKVNNVFSVNGNIALNSDHIPRSGSDPTTVDAALTTLSDGLSELSGEVVAITDAEIDAALEV